ncbi:hypothetical protein K502DRAFT_293697, partial [Neoconidiobolus thromboides FSU 785]
SSNIKSLSINKEVFRWALKEAIYKAGYPRIKFTWKEVEIYHQNSKPCIRILSNEAEASKQNDDSKILISHCSLSHDEDILFAQVLLESN